MACEFSYHGRTFETREELENYIQPILDMYNSSSEIQKVGTFEEYSEYIGTIFPDSKIKSIVYHRSREKFDEFDFSRLGQETGNQAGVFFSDQHLSYLEGFPFEIKAVVNVQDLSNRSSYGSFRTTEGVKVKVNQVVIQRPEQIHILGSKKDTEGFVKFKVDKMIQDGRIQKKNCK